MFSAQVKIGKINYRIGILRARGEMMNLRLIKALEREKRALERSLDGE